jgi:hypothetical protein
MAQMPVGYFNRYTPTKHYEKHLFTAGSAIQSAEFNEIQEYSLNRIQRIGDALFKDGDVIKNAVISVNASSGYVRAQAGLIYIDGAVRDVAARNFTIPTVGDVSVGVYIVETVVTALEDPSLRDPATGTRNYQQPGASRLKIEIQWGYEGEMASDFFAVYEIGDGVLKAKVAPPEMDSVTQAIARYDRDSAGDGYIVSGLNVSKLNDSGSDQVYSVASGMARVRGYAMEFSTATRLTFDPDPDLNFVDSEPQTSTTAGAQRVNLDYTPVAEITGVRITKQKTVTMTHGAYSGALDQIEDEAVLLIVSVTQGGTTYTQGADYRLTSGKVDWSLTGLEPAPGSTYTVVYQAITLVTPTDVDSTGCTVTGAVTGSLILVSYNQYLPRIDAVVINADGEIEHLKGVSSAYNPQPPRIPASKLQLAHIIQTWTSSRRVVNNGVRVVPMNEIADLRDRIDYALSLIAQQRLESDINTREAGAKKGLFTEPFIDDSQRDQGLSQTAAIFDGEMTLPITGSIADLNPGTGIIRLNKAPGSTAYIAQNARSSGMDINPYDAFALLPAEVTLSPSIDRWTDVVTVWASPLTRALTLGSGWQAIFGTATTTNLLSTRTIPASELRQIDVQFTLSGFRPGEELSSVSFDGVTVTPTAI